MVYLNRFRSVLSVVFSCLAADYEFSLFSFLPAAYLPFIFDKSLCLKANARRRKLFFRNVLVLSVF